VLELRAQSHALVLRLEDPGDAEAIGEARRFAREAGLGRVAEDAASEREGLHAMLDRPGALCGMVPNTGEPARAVLGVRRDDRVTRQIVESAQVRAGDSRQLACSRRRRTSTRCSSRAPSTTPAAGASTSANSSTPTAVIVTRARPAAAIS